MVLPISCNECRRRKIRCDRVQSCKNCLKRDIKCTYPNKFRSIDINQIQTTSSTQISSSPSTPSSNTSSLSPPSLKYSSPSEIQELIRKQSKLIEQQKFKISELQAKLSISEDLISIFDTSGSGTNNYSLKYFGDNSINCLEFNMMNGLIHIDNSINYKRINQEKKNLPLLVQGSHDSDENIEAIKQVVDKFFNADYFSFVNDMIDQDEIKDFLTDYKDIVDWNHDEKMLLLLAILMDVLKTSETFKNCGVSFGQKQGDILKILTQYYFQISKIQPHDSLNLIKSQVLIFFYYYYVYDFNKAWKILFQIISNAYSIGLHVSQGPVWLKINVLESIICSISSRPNLLQNQLMRKCNIVDEFGEFEFIELLRLKNKVYVDSFAQRISLVQYEDILRLDSKFDTYSSFLFQKLIEYKDTSHFGYRKTCFLLLMTLSIQLNLHFEKFETNKQSDRKTLELFGKYIQVLNKFVGQHELCKIRESFAAAECLLYQFLLIFLKYFNFKSVQYIKKSYNVLENDEDMKLLQKHQRHLGDLILNNPGYSNVRVSKVFELISSVNLDELTSETLIQGDCIGIKNDLNPINERFGEVTDNQSSVTEGTILSKETDLSTDLTPVPNFYTNEEIRYLLEDSVLQRGLRDITEFLPRNHADYREYFLGE